VRIEILLPRDRNRYGDLSLISEPDKGVKLPEQRLLHFPCFGKADNQGAADHGNPTRDPLKPFGDTPLGDYVGTVVRFADGQIKDHDTLRKYGPYGYIVLTAVAGDALKAQDAGRFGLLIHGGDPGLNGILRPTFGCIRLANAHIAGLLGYCRAGEHLRVSMREAA